METIYDVSSANSLSSYDDRSAADYDVKSAVNTSLKYVGVYTRQTDIQQQELLKAMNL